MASDAIAKETERELNLVLKEVEYKEINTTVRHYSNMRFLIIPIFFAINGGMFYGIRNGKESLIPSMYVLLALLSTVVSLVFCRMERALNSYLDTFVDQAVILKNDSFWRKRPPTKNSVSNHVVLLYCSVALCWLMLAGYQLFGFG